MSIAEQVEIIVKDCLYKDGEIPNGETPPEAIIVEGIMNKFGFHPDRVQDHKEEIRAILDQMPDEFHMGKGGGWSFLNLCNDKNGNQWGEHRNMDLLVCLAIASDLGKYLMPREMWSAFPGGMPYVGFDTAVKAEVSL